MAIKQFNYCFFEGKQVRLNQAKVSIMTNALQYGTAVFAGIRGYYDYQEKQLVVFRPEDHYRRFLGSLKILGTKVDYSLADLQQITFKLTRKNQPRTDVYFRPFAYAGSTNLGPNLYKEAQFSFALYMIPLGDYLSTDKGLKVMVSSWRRPSDNAIPPRAKIAGAYVSSALARGEAVRLGFDEAITLTDEGHVAEGSAENLFLVRQGVLVTPEITDEVLEGITRKTLIQLAVDLGIPVEERRVDRTELYVAEEVFFSGTGVQLAWIKQIDGRQVGRGRMGPVTEKLRQLFFKVVRGKQPEYQQWCYKLRY